MSRLAVSHNLARLSRARLSSAGLSSALLVACLVLLPLTALGGALRVGPTRIDLSTRRPVVALEVQNAADGPTLAQIDVFTWTQEGAGDVLVPTTDVITTPLVISLAAGETRIVRVGLREPNRTAVERSYRLFVREVAPTAAPGTGLRFALRIGVPVFALPADARSGAVGAPGELSWRWMPDINSCATIQLSNPSAHHDRVLAAEMLSRGGEVLWESAEPTYVLARSKRSLSPALCPPNIKEAVTLQLQMESGTLSLPVEAPSLVVDANSH
jgi:fimbrial chaperone protein